jgi:hypothetical protein
MGQIFQSRFDSHGQGLSNTVIDGVAANGHASGDLADRLAGLIPEENFWARITLRSGCVREFAIVWINSSSPTVINRAARLDLPATRGQKHVLHILSMF